MVAHHEITAEAHVGLAGDRYGLAIGTYSGQRLDDAERGVTLFAQETLEAVAAEHGIVLRADETRRNLLVSGVPVDDLLGVEFTVGGVVLRGVDLAHPCSYLQDLTQPGVLRALTGRGGLRAEVLTSGTIAIGDGVEWPGAFTTPA
jgi:MOSC domain-containing protein YiiM